MISVLKIKIKNQAIGLNKHFFSDRIECFYKIAEQLGSALKQGYDFPIIQEDTFPQFEIRHGLKEMNKFETGFIPIKAMLLLKLPAQTQRILCIQCILNLTIQPEIPLVLILPKRELDLHQTVDVI